MSAPTARLLKREKVDIISAILSIVAEGETCKTHLMYKSNLDSRALKKYIILMVEKGFLSTKKDDHESYHLTEKGRDFLQRYNGLEMLLV
jgi:predicted transcriptional regulator